MYCRKKGWVDGIPMCHVGGAVGVSRSIVLSGGWVGLLCVV